MQTKDGKREVQRAMQRIGNAVKGQVHSCTHCSWSAGDGTNPTNLVSSRNVGNEPFNGDNSELWHHGISLGCVLVKLFDA